MEVYSTDNQKCTISPWTPSLSCLIDVRQNKIQCQYFALTVLPVDGPFLKNSSLCSKAKAKGYNIPLKTLETVFYVLLNRNQRNFFSAPNSTETKLFHRKKGSTSGKVSTHCVWIDILHTVGSRSLK